MIGSAVSEPPPASSRDARAAFEQTRVQIKDVARIRFASGRPLQDERDLAISDGVLRQIVINDERIHAVIHEPLAHGRAGERREILVRRAIGSRRGNDRRVGHRAFLFQNGEGARDIGIFLTDRDVNAIERPIILQLPVLRRLVQTRLADDGVDRDRRFAGRAIADDQLALAATDRNHRVDRHDAGLHRLADALALDDAGRDFFQRIKRLRFDRALAIERLAERVHDAAEQAPCRPAPGEACRSFWLRRLPMTLRGIAEQNRADFGFFEVERETEDAAREIRSSRSTSRRSGLRCARRRRRFRGQCRRCFWWSRFSVPRFAFRFLRECCS